MKRRPRRPGEPGRAAGDLRRRTALQKALAISRKIDRLQREPLDGPDEETDRAEELSEAAEKLIDVLAEYPDVFPNPPVPTDVAREHINALKEANAEVRKNQAELEALEKQREEAERQLDALLAEATSPKKKPSLPN